MQNRIRYTLTLALLCAALTTVMSASENAYMYLVHGIPGRDYSTTTDPQFPVDVLINDETCNLRGLTYGAIQGPLTFVPGTYDVKISLANTLVPCSNAPIVESSVTLASGENVSAVFSLNDSGAPALSTLEQCTHTVCARRRFSCCASDPGEHYHQEAAHLLGQTGCVVKRNAAVWELHGRSQSRHHNPGAVDNCRLVFPIRNSAVRNRRGEQ